MGKIDQPEGNPFLNTTLIIDTAISAGADAIHPGYGYLSENADFADAVRRAGLIFVGPGSKAMSTLGNKRTSKEYLRRFAPTVPLIPGFEGTSQYVQDLENAAEHIGFPVMLKASAGGGGRGMRIVQKRQQLSEELKLVHSEAARSFGSSDCILEKYIEAGKHIEIQIIGDSHGQILALGERECSVQRRHQKVIEETPSPWLTSQKRQEMCDVAVQIGQLLNYEGAGTVEFVYDVTDDSFYFLEVNTRLQVEHPITEEVTGLDIVSLQLFVAAGGRFTSLPVLKDISQNGHAIECRLCAEDPERGFLPEQGTIRLWKPAYPTVSDLRDVRFETAVRTGSQITIYFDSMIAKIIVWAPTRSLAISKMVNILSNTACIGIRTNQQFLKNCLLHTGFKDPAYTTSFISSNTTTLHGYPNPSLNKAGASITSAAPGLILRRLQSLDRMVSGIGSFTNVRRGFRNQRYDPINLDINVISDINQDKALEPVIVIWASSREVESSQQKISMLPVPKLPHSQDGKDITSPNTSTTYNMLSNFIRNIKASTDNGHEIELRNLIMDKSNDPHGSQQSWRAGFFEMVIDGLVVTGHCVVEHRCNYGVKLAKPKTVLCHFLVMGTWVEYRCYDLLTYSESIREANASISPAQMRSVKAPMPCRVLSLAKQAGEQVKSGEVVMVVESMKMEMNIFAPVDGVFCSSVKKGDAVDDGELLCWID